MTRCAAIAIVCSPLEQKRFTVTPLVVIGKPARSAICRAMLLPVAPSGVAQPISTSSTSAASIPARSTAAFTAKPPSVAPWVMLKAPFQLFASGVRAVETITALVMVCSSGSNGGGWLLLHCSRGLVDAVARLREHAAQHRLELAD